MPTQNQVYATGKRKTSIARVYLREGSGNYFINHRKIENYFRRATDRMIIEQPFALTETVGRFDVYVNVSGGGLSGQAGAIRHGISKALSLVDLANRPVLKKNGLITRDARIKERKKYGQRGARARFQFSKR